MADVEEVPPDMIPTEEEARAMAEMEKKMDHIILSAAVANLDKTIDLSGMEASKLDVDTDKLQSSVDDSMKDLDAALAEL